MQNRSYRVALNGYGRIGRCVLRALHERGPAAGLEIVALNDLADQASVEYLTRFDSTHGRFPGAVEVDGDCLHINGECVKVLRHSTPEAIDWAALGIDLLLECSGQYTSREQARRFINAGAPRVLLSQPMASEADIDATVVYGVNQQCLRGTEQQPVNTARIQEIKQAIAEGRFKIHPEAIADRLLESARDLVNTASNQRRA